MIINEPGGVRMTLEHLKCSSVTLPGEEKAWFFRAHTHLHTLLDEQLSNPLLTEST